MRSMPCLPHISLLVLVCIALFATVSAEDPLPEAADSTNLTAPSPDYPADMVITIDPIGNHTIGEIFFINGTTNLPVSEPLTMELVSYNYIQRPHMKNEVGLSPNKSAYISDISIVSALPGENRWSVNATDVAEKLESGKYFVDVHSKINFSCDTLGCWIPEADAIQIFTLLPASDRAERYSNRSTKSFLYSTANQKNRSCHQHST